MPFSIGVIRAGSTDVPVDTIRTLHTELAAVGLPVFRTEAGAAPRFGVETSHSSKPSKGAASPSTSR